jgi:chromate reductase
MGVHVVGICGSLRRESFNRKLLMNAIERAPDGLSIETTEIRDFPLYDDDLAVAAFPEVVTAVKARIQAADGLLLVTPEYNFNVPGPLKNAVDWLSRPYPDPTLRTTPAGVIGASTGWAGTVRAQLGWRQVWGFLQAPMYDAHQVHLTMAAKAFDELGRLTDELHCANLDAYLAGFRDWLVRVKCMRAE